jgi:co-chaperonin GroES (HSP10)
VIAVGPGGRDKKPAVTQWTSEGDRVLFGKWSGTESNLTGRYLM